MIHGKWLQYGMVQRLNQTDEFSHKPLDYMWDYIFFSFHFRFVALLQSLKFLLTLPTANFIACMSPNRMSALVFQGALDG
jgi:hypothetical protein